MKYRPSPELGARNKSKIFLDTIFQNKLEFGKFGTLQLDLCGVSYIYLDTGLQASWSLEDSYPPTPHNIWLGIRHSESNIVWNEWNNDWVKEQLPWGPFPKEEGIVDKRWRMLSLPL